MTDSISGAETLPVTTDRHFACPWCRIGKANLDAAIARMHGAPVDVTYLPFFLDPTLPAEGKDFREHLTEKFQGAPSDDVRACLPGRSTGRSGIPLGSGR